MRQVRDNVRAEIEAEGLALQNAIKEGLSKDALQNAIKEGLSKDALKNAIKEELSKDAIKDAIKIVSDLLDEEVDRQNNILGCLKAIRDYTNG